MKGKIREILNKIKWTNKESYSDYYIIYLHRGVPLNQKEICFDKIIKITPSFIIFKSNEFNEETYIPFHRILKIYNKKTDEILWEK